MAVNFKCYVLKPDIQELFLFLVRSLYETGRSCTFCVLPFVSCLIPVPTLVLNLASSAETGLDKINTGSDNTTYHIR